MACAPTSTTLYLAPDFEVRDGLATTYVKAGQTNIPRVEEPAFATTFFPDVAPLGAGTSAAARRLLPPRASSPPMKTF